MLFSSINANFEELLHLLNQLSDERFSEPCPDLGNATIGEHYRHVIEIFTCLIDNYESGIINYDQRGRDQRIATRPEFAAAKISWIRAHMEKPDKEIILRQPMEGFTLNIRSNYLRELLYNLEHSIHHQALIKIAVQKYRDIRIPDTFGVARSTIAYQKNTRCAS